VNATEALYEARKHGAVFTVSGEDRVGVAAPMRLPGSLISIGLTQLRVILNRNRMVLSLGNLIQLRNS
jgi:hypothetical protein